LKILNERAEQERLKAEGRFKYTCADLEMSNSEKAVVLVEEVGEVCRAVLESNGLVHDGRKVGNYAQLQKELIQVAAVAVAWLEALKKSNVS
jgi:NTP pyrophosphatase (non-canonical NTP hydrolase)